MFMIFYVTDNGDLYCEKDLPDRAAVDEWLEGNEEYKAIVLNTGTLTTEDHT